MLALPSDETERLARLASLHVLDTGPCPRLDSLTARALALFPDAFGAAISLVDARRVWYKSLRGLDVQECSRDIAFCAHAVLVTTLTVVPDLLEDNRFARNVLVTGEPKLRFYVGAPLSGGVGMMCVFGTQATKPSPAQLEQLTRLALLADTQLLAYGALRTLDRPLNLVREQA